MITQIGDRYDLLELLGEGGMGAVYRARDRELDEIVALKLIRPELAADPGMIERFRREVKLARRVTHGNVARTFELGSADGHVFCTMELVDGESLTARLKRDKRLPVGEAVAIACALCDGLAAAHAVSVVHRDMKPDNVLLARDGRVVIADFGVAAVHTGDGGELSGTPAYMAPEQARGDPATPAADVYAVGIVLYEMLVGHRAFQGGAAQVLGDKQTFERILPGPGEAPPELAEVIGRATARDVTARPANARELRRALEPWARAPRAETQPQPVPDDREQLQTIVVLIPRGEGKLYLAEAIYDEILALLSREPRLRVLSRADALEPGAITLHLECGERLVARAERDGKTIVAMDVPLAIDKVTMAAESIYRGMCKFGTPKPTRADPRELEALELMLQARHNMRRDLRLGKLAIEQAQRAYELAPSNPRVLATFAIVTVRWAFFEGAATDEAMLRAADFARAAVMAAPELFEPHLALGHVELNAGNPVAAARHYRTAIARSPHSAEAHEYMGRMLLEAGYLELAFARLDEALAINPARIGLHWESARAYALEGRWEEYDRLVALMRDVKIQRPYALARMATWRGDDNPEQAVLPELRTLVQSFAPGLMEVLIDVYSRMPWHEVRDRVLSIAQMKWSNRRRRTWVAQICAEAAGWAGDPETAASLVAIGTADGLFDLHWLDKCPLLAGMRALPYFAQLRAPIERRADAILDAMYGDHDLGTSETAVATS